MDKDAILKKVKEETHKIYQNASHDLPFHGWHHIEFVEKQSLRFSEELGADPFLVAIAALVHDLNYVVDTDSKYDAGKNMRIELLQKSGLNEEIEIIETIITEADRSIRTADISAEAKALSDADTLFKCLPVTPILFAKDFLIERSTSLRKIANLIIKTQTPLLEKNIFFYSTTAKKYLPWAKANLELWGNVIDFLEDKEISLNVLETKKL